VRLPLATAKPRSSIAHAWGAAALGGQPAGQHPGQRGHHPAHLTHLITRRTEELDVLGQLRDPVGLDVFAA
jgi:hypothetical protein